VKTLYGIYFATGKSDILPQSYNELHRLLETLRAHPEMRIELRGHTDNQGTADFNMKLSEARAAAVAEYLTGKGIEPHRLTTKGFGKTMPIDSNTSPEGRSHNRRVEYRVLPD
jgi:outer membrane protein OmpA-like peptidoglycan-associated protein